MSVTRNIIFILLSVVFALIQAEAQEMQSVLDSVRMRLERIDAYEVDAIFRVDIDFVNMPEKEATIRFSSPDKLDIDTDGFLMVPKVGIRPVTRQMSLDKYHSLYLGEEPVNGDTCYTFKLIPNERKSRIILSTIWISRDYRITRWESYTRSSGNVMLDMSYDGLDLPSEIIFSFEVTGMNIPVKYFGSEVEVDKKAMKESEVIDGRVIVSFRNYKIQYISQSATSD